ncbi:MAG: hypothetical protein OEV20_01060 [Actinomycetota bacterium]|nr:hypothetical protein [Actinomycetota bacterium]
MGLRGPVDLAANLVLDAEGTRRLAARGEVSTDERNLLQMRSPELVRRATQVLRLDAMDGVGAVAACDGATSARTASTPLVRALLRAGHGERAGRCATAIAQPSEQALAAASIAMAAGDRAALRRELERSFHADPDSLAARFAVLEAQQPWRRATGADFERTADGLDDPSRLVIEAWRLERARSWKGLSALDGALGSIGHDHPAGRAAARARARWRVELGGAARAREAIELIDRVLPGSGWPRDDLLLRTRATFEAGYGAATVATLSDFAQANMGEDRDISLARAALAIEARLGDDLYAGDERIRLRRRLGARR